MKLVLPFVGAVLATLAFIFVGGGAGGLRLQVPNGAGVGAAPAATADAHAHATAATTVAIVPPPGGSQLALTTARAAKPELGYQIAVKVTSPAGKPVNDATVRFYDIVDLLGQREELIGSAVTDGQGLTAITYLPAMTGTHQIVARFAGQGTLEPSLGVSTFEASVATPKYQIEESAFASFSRYVPYAAGFIVLAVWGLIAFSLFGTARGVVAHAHETHQNQKGDTA